jgi:hypothetical protein
VTGNATDEAREGSATLHELEVVGALNPHDREGLELELRHLAKRHGLRVRIARAPMAR